jgi:type IV/VI secretion system ImpK/VasF family protein
MTNPSGFPQFELLLRLQPCLHAVIEIYGEAAGSDANNIRERCKSAVLATRATFHADRLLREKEDDLTRALVALLDELGARKFRKLGEWATLQYELFREAMLGDDVIAAMERLCTGRPRDDPERTYVYYLCLVLGFRGRYGDCNIERDGDKQLAALRQRLREPLIELGWFAATRTDDLCPARAQPAGPPAPEAAPLWPWLFAFCVFLGVLTEFVVLRHYAQQAVGDVVRQLAHPTPKPARNRV